MNEQDIKCAMCGNMFKNFCLKMLVKECEKYPNGGFVRMYYRDYQACSSCCIKYNVPGYIRR